MNKDRMAIFKVGSKQFLAQEGDKLVVDRQAQVKDKIVFKEVLLTKNGKDVKIGTPLVSGATVEAKILSHPRGAKGLSFRYRPKKRVRVLKGYRADLTEVEIISIKG